jgi:hypothetical protein
MGIIYEVRFPSGKYWIGSCIYDKIDNAKANFKSGMRESPDRNLYKQLTIEECSFENIVFTIRELLNTRDTTKLRTRLYNILDAEGNNPDLLPHRRTCL